MILVPLSAALIVRALLFVRSSRAFLSLMVRLLGFLLAVRFGRILESVLCHIPLGAYHTTFSPKMHLLLLLKVIFAGPRCILWQQVKNM